MKIYLSGGGVVGTWLAVNKQIIEMGIPRLISFAYAKIAQDFSFLVEECQRDTTFLLDSGAFTSWTKGEKVDIDDLSSFFEKTILSNRYLSDAVMINLDVIPGRKGVDPTPAEIDAAMIDSDKNYDLLNSRFPGKILPVFHQGEPQSYLDHILGKTDHICLSPRNDVIEKQRVRWVSEVFRPGMKAHGLATTGNLMMNIVDWFSVDSATWIMTAAVGGIMWRRPGGKIDLISISNESSDRKIWNAHLDNLCESERKHIIETLESRGYDLAYLRASQPERSRWNSEVLLNYTAKPIEYSQGTLF